MNSNICVVAAAVFLSAGVAACSGSGGSTEIEDDGGMGQGGLDGGGTLRDASVDAPPLLLDGAPSQLDADAPQADASVDATLSLADGAIDASADAPIVADASADAASSSPDGSVPSRAACDFTTTSPFRVIDAPGDNSNDHAYPFVRADILLSGVFIDDERDPFVAALRQITTVEDLEVESVTYDFQVSRLKPGTGTACEWSAPVTIDGVIEGLRIESFPLNDTTLALDYDAEHDQLLIASMAHSRMLTIPTPHVSAVAVPIKTAASTVTPYWSDLAEGEYAKVPTIRAKNGVFHAAFIRRASFCTTLCDRVSDVRFNVDSHGGISMEAMLADDAYLDAHSDDPSDIKGSEVAVDVDAAGEAVFAWIETYEEPIGGGMTNYHSYLLISTADPMTRARTTNVIREQMSTDQSIAFQASLDLRCMADGTSVVASNLTDVGPTGEVYFKQDIWPTPMDGGPLGILGEPFATVVIGYADDHLLKIAGARLVLHRSRITGGSGDGTLLYFIQDGHPLWPGGVRGAFDVSDAFDPVIEGAQTTARASDDKRLWTSLVVTRDDVENAASAALTLPGAGVYVWREPTP